MFVICPYICSYLLAQLLTHVVTQFGTALAHHTKYDYSVFDFFNEENWKNKKESPFDVFFEEEGFEEIEYEDMKMYDVLFFKNVNKFAPTFSCHMAMYVGSQTMMHQPFNRVSELSPFTSRHLRFVTKIIRHKKLL